MQAEEWAARAERFPEHTPVNKEYYLLRAIFEEHYPKKCALDTIPKGLSVACSTPEAISWDPEWANLHDISGRAVSFHSASDAYTSADEMDVARAPEAVAARARGFSGRRVAVGGMARRLPQVPRGRVSSLRQSARVVK